MTIDHVAAPAGEVSWRYEPVPNKGAKCLLLNPGMCLIVGPPQGDFMKEYIAWAPMPKRDKEAEKRLLPQPHQENP